MTIRTNLEAKAEMPRVKPSALWYARHDGIHAMSRDWVVHFFDLERGREGESRSLSSLVEAVSLAETYEKRGCVARFLASPDGKMHWPLSKRHPGD